MSVQLFVLGVLAEGPAHGYQLKEVARGWDLGRWAAVGFGSIYHALERLSVQGLVEEAQIERQGRRPPRSIYRITAAGRDSFAEMVRMTCAGVHNPKFPIDLRVAFLRHLPPGERRAVLGERLTGFEELQE